ncbi:MAG: hypothetical protein WC910_08675 [Bacteroidales bacterium]|jgi:hypothetical protein
MNNAKLAKKIAGRILKMDGPNKKEGYRLAIMFRGENGKETSPGGRNKDTLVECILSVLNDYNY